MATVTLQKMKIERATLRVHGTAPLVTNRFTEKAKAQILAKKQGKKSKDREPCKPEEEYIAAAYLMSDGGFGFPADGIKKCVMNAAHRDMGMPRTIPKHWLFILADEINEEGRGLVRIHCDSGAVMNESAVKVGINQTDLRYRPLFWPWWMDVRFEYDSEWLDLEGIANLFQRAGYGIGLGEDRPERQGGSWGRFELAQEGKE